MADIAELQVQYQAGIIKGNFEEVKTSLQSKLSDYQNIVYTADMVKDAKKDVADLRKLKKVIDDKRKEIKKTWNDPYMAFEDMTKELISLIDKPIREINSQLEEFEQQRLEEKRNKIDEEYVKRFDSTLMEYCPLSKIFDDKWLNTSTSMKSIKDVLDAKKTFIVTSIQTIKDCGEETAEKALQMFKANLNLQEVLAWINQYRLQKEQILEKQRLAEQERIRKEDEERARQEERERQAREEAERKKAEEEMAKQEREQKQESAGFGVATSEQGFSSNVQPTQGFCGFQQVQSEQKETQGFATQPEQGFGGFQTAPREVIFTVRVLSNQANQFEELIKQWGYTNFDRR